MYGLYFCVVWYGMVWYGMVWYGGIQGFSFRLEVEKVVCMKIKKNYFMVRKKENFFVVVAIGRWRIY